MTYSHNPHKFLISILLPSLIAAGALLLSACNTSQIKSLAGLDFIGRAQNIVFIGPPGTGKTGLAVGLLRQALINGHRGRF